MHTARKLLALVLMAVLLCSALLFARADEGLQIRAGWGEGNEPIDAQIVEGTDGDYWIQLPEAAFGEVISLEITDLFGRFASWSSDQCDPNGAGTMTVRVPANTGETAQDWAAIVLSGYDEMGNVLITFRLYLSSAPAPAAPQAAAAQVPVVYQTEDGQVLGRETLTVEPGTSQTVYANTYDNYVVVGDAAVTVTVDENGIASPAQAVIMYRALAVDARVTVIHQAEDGTLLKQDQVTIASGSQQTVRAESFQGYAASEGYPSEVTVTVDGNGNANPAQVVFMYRALPTSAQVTVIHQAEDGTLLNTEQLDIPNGTARTITARSFSGYALAEGIPDEITVTVDNAGIANPAQAVFTYHALPATVLIRYQSIDGAQLDAETRTVERGSSALIEAKAIDGYVIAENTPSSATVTVDAMGVASPDTVTFLYKALPDSAQVTIVYQTAEGVQIGTETRAIARGASETIEAKAIDGYVIAENTPSSATVTVDAMGVASPAGVTFVYRKVVDATVVVSYRNIRGDEIAPADSVIIPGGETMTITPDRNRIPNTYDADTASPADVRVTADTSGHTDPAQVIFTFNRLPDAEETPIPLGLDIQRWAKTTKKGVNVRRTMNKNSNSLGTINNTGSKIWVIRENTNDSGEKWYSVLYNGKEGYIRSDLLSVLSQAESDDIQDSLTTPVPTFTPVPGTPTPTPVPPTPTPTPEWITPTPAPALYDGYTINVYQGTLLEAASENAGPITSVEPSTLLKVNWQVYVDGTLWSNVSTLDNRQGFIRDEELWRITDEQAQMFIDTYEREHSTATPAPVAVITPEPVQTSGYYRPLADGALLRAAPNYYSEVYRILNGTDVVYVTGQVYDTEDGYPWHKVIYENGSTVKLGYVRWDLLEAVRENDIIDVQTPPDVSVITPSPYDPAQALSCFGLVTSDYPVSLYSDPVKRGSAGTVNSNTLCEITDSQLQTNGRTWYEVTTYDSNTKNGWISEDYLHPMTITEYNEYVRSAASRPVSTYSPDAGIVVTPEPREQRVADQWQASGVPYTDWTPEETANYGDTFVTAPPVQPNPDETQESPAAEVLPTVTPDVLPTVPPVTNEPGNPGLPTWLLVIIIVAVVGGGAAGAAAYFHNKNKRAAARRAAQRRAQASRENQAAAQRPKAAAYPNVQQTKTGTTASAAGSQNAGAAAGFAKTAASVTPAGTVLRSGTAAQTSKETLTSAPGTSGNQTSPYQRPANAGSTYTYQPQAGSVQPAAPAAPVQTSKQNAAPSAPVQTSKQTTVPTGPVQTSKQTAADTASAPEVRNRRLQQPPTGPEA